MIDRKRFRYIMNGSGVQTQAARVDNFLKSIDLLSPLTDGQRHTLSQYLTTEKFEDAEYVCEVYRGFSSLSCSHTQPATCNAPL